MSDAAREVYWMRTGTGNAGRTECACSAWRKPPPPRKVLDAFGAPPLPMMTQLDENLTQAEIGTMLSPEQLTGVAAVCRGEQADDKLLKPHRLAGRDAGQLQAGASKSLRICRQKSSAAYSEDEIRDDASALLRDLRRKKMNLEMKDQR